MTRDTVAAADPTERSWVAAWLDEQPWANRIYAPYRRWRDRWVTPAGRYLVLTGLLIGIFALEVEDRQAYVFWSVLFGLGTGSVLLSRGAPPRMKMLRRLPPRVTAGTPVGYTVELTSTHSRSVGPIAVREEDLPFGLSPVVDDGLGRVVADLAPGQTRSVRMVLTARRHGVYDLPALRVERTCPLGLTRSGRTHAVRSRLVVHPRVWPIGSVDFTRARVYQPGGVPMAASTGESTELVGLRPYQPGDAMRTIDWKAWARTGTPVSREYQGEYFRRVAVVLDTHAARTASARRGFDAATSVGASLVRYFQSHEYVIDILAAGEQVYYLQSGMGLHPMEDVLDLLACVSPTRGVSLPRLDDTLCRLMGRLSGLVLIATDWRPETREFHARLLADVPEIKVILVREGEATLPADADVAQARLLKRVRPAAIEEDIVAL